MTRRLATLLAALIPVVLLVVVGGRVTVPFVSMGPGPIFNTLGETQVRGEDGSSTMRPVVDVEGTDVDPTSGELNLTTVAVRDQLNLFEAISYWFSGRDGVVPRSQVYPADRSTDEVREENSSAFSESESNAEVAALRQLGLPTAVSVASVSNDGPASGVLEADDELVALDGQQVSSGKQVQDIIGGKHPGDRVAIEYRRDGTVGTADLVLAPRPHADDRGYLGIVPTVVPKVPFDVTFHLEDIGGPSAGMMFALALVDKLSPGELTGGTLLAGTGTIDPDGNVGPIGGVQYKVTASRDAGASAFIVPTQNCSLAKDANDGAMTLIRVDTLADAVHGLEQLNRGETPATCD